MDIKQYQKSSQTSITILLWILLLDQLMECINNFLNVKPFVHS